MVLTVNVSNTSVLLGAYEEGRQAFFASLHTNLSKTSDEYAVQMQSVLALYGRTPAEITGVIFSCVVPSLLSCIRHALSHLYSGRIYTVGPGLKTGLAIRMDDPSQLGSELVCCAVEVLAAYPHPCVIVSFDTATTMIALDEKGTMRGGTILPGVRTGMDALSIRTAQLPQIDLAAPQVRCTGHQFYGLYAGRRDFGHRQHAGRDVGPLCSRASVPGIVLRRHRRNCAGDFAPLQSPDSLPRESGVGRIVSTVSQKRQMRCSRREISGVYIK